MIRGCGTALLCGALVFSALGLLAASDALSCEQSDQNLLAVIIDDLGYSRARGEAVLALPQALTLSFIPDTPHTRSLATEAGARGHEIMVHMPMTSSHSSVTDPVVLTENLTEEAFEALIDRAITAVPGAVGLNNHMGSELTTQPDAMSRLMARLKDWGLFFIDSRTTAETVAADRAAAAGIPVASRSVFLDHEPTAIAVQEQLDAAIQQARQNGAAIAIGHPHDSTLSVLREKLAVLPPDIKLVPASTITTCSETQRLTSMPRDAM